MHVVVFTRSTPDTAATVEVAADGASVTWGDQNVVNPWDEYAIEEAITRAKDTGGESTVIAIGSEMHEEALRHSLAMGIGNAVRIDADDGGDSLTYARLAAAAVGKLDGVSLVILGKESVDVGTDAHNIMLARKLGWPMLSYVARIIDLDPDAATIKVERLLEEGRQTVTSPLPAVMSVMKEINEPRYPSFMGIRKANKAKIPVWSAADLGLDLPAAPTQRIAYRPLPKTDAEVEMIDGTPAEMAAKLVDRLMEEKLL